MQESRARRRHRRRKPRERRTDVLAWPDGFSHGEATAISCRGGPGSCLALARLAGWRSASWRYADRARGRGPMAVPLGVFHRVLHMDLHGLCIHGVRVFAGREGWVGHAGEHVTLRAPVRRRADGACGDLAAILPAVMRRSRPRRADMHTALLAMARCSSAHGIASFRRALYLYYRSEVHYFGLPHTRAGFATLRCSLPTGRTRAFASREEFSPTRMSPEKMIDTLFAPAGANSARLF